MKRLDALLLSSFLRFFLLSLAVFFLVFAAVSVFDELEVFMYFKASFFNAAMLILARTPLMIAYSLPISCLISIMATVAVMTRNGEITALRASGISLARISLPFFIASLLVAGLHFALQETLVPPSLAYAQEVKQVHIKKRQMKTLVRDANVWIKFGDSMIHADRIRPGDKGMEGVTVYERSGYSVMRTLSAKSAEWTGREWVLHTGRTRTFLAEGGWTEADFDRLPYPVSIPPEELSVIILEPENTSMASLGKKIKGLRLQGQDVTALTAAYWRKTVLPFASILMPFLAIPFAIRTTARASAWRAVGVGVCVGLLFLGAVMAGGSLGKTGALHPMISAWTGFLAFLPLAWLLMRKAERGG